MDNDESILVILSFVFTIVLFVATVFKGPQMGILNKNVYLDKTRLTAYGKFLAIMVVCSIPIGYVVSRNTALVFKFAGLNAFISALMSLNLMLRKK